MTLEPPSTTSTTATLTGKRGARRSLIAPADLAIPFWPMRAPLAKLESYDSTAFWFTGMNPKTKRVYSTHLRLFCLFYSTTPDILAQLTADQLKVLLDAYLMYLIKIAVKVAGKPKPGQVSVNSVGLYFAGLRSFFVDGHEKEINWKRYENKFPEKVSNKLRSYYYEEVQKLYKNADIYDKPIVLLEYGTWVRVGAVGPLRFRDMLPIPEYNNQLCFLKVYAESMEDWYPVVLGPEFMTDIKELKEYRERVWGEKITPDSFLICPKYSPHCKVRKNPKPMSESGIRKRIRQLAKKAGVDLTNIQPNHGMRKAGNTAAKNAHMDKEFKELLMGHSTGLDDVYYDIEVPQSRKEIIAEYLKALPFLTINDSSRLKSELAVKEQENKKLQAQNEENTRLYLDLKEKLRAQGLKVD